MKNPIDHYWNLRLEALQKTLEKNNFEVHRVDSGEAASTLVQEVILPGTGAKSVSWGGSMTFVRSGLYHALKDRTDLRVIDTNLRDVPREELYEKRRESLGVDLFISGTNAVTETGALVNLDMLGNRVAGITFGPRHVVVLVGRNKVVPDVEDAMVRIKNYAAPVNAMRLDMKTPCTLSSFCEDCSGPNRICNTWTITEKSFPKGRIKVVLINADMGL